MSVTATGGTDKPTVAILGTGALGVYYGGRLAQHGHDVASCSMSAGCAL